MFLETTIQKIKKEYQDTRTKKNLERLNDQLQDVTRIMTTNIQDVIGRGEKIDKLSEMSGHLSVESKKYLRDTKKLNLQILYQKYGPPVVVILVVVFVIYIRLWWF